MRKNICTIINMILNNVSASKFVAYGKTMTYILANVFYII